MKVYINNTYCPDAVAEDLFGDIIYDPNIKYRNFAKVIASNGILYNIVLINPYKHKIYFEINDE